MSNFDRLRHDRFGLGDCACLVVALMLLLAPLPAAGQSASRRDVFAGVGVSRVGGDEGSLGSGTSLVAGAAVRLTTRASVEADLMWTRHDRFIGGGPLEGSATGVFASALYHFATGSAQPFVIGSAGLLVSKTTSTLPLASGPFTFRSDDTGFAWGGGGGVKIVITPRFSLRPQFRIVFSEATGVMGLATGSIATAYHW